MNNQKNTRTFEQCQIDWRNSDIGSLNQNMNFRDAEKTAETFEDAIWLLSRLPFPRISENSRFVKLALEKAETEKQCEQVLEKASSIQIPIRASEQRKEIVHSIGQNWVGAV